MADYITLMSAEDVSRAANRMQSAADSMKTAASNFDESSRHLMRFMDDWLARLETLLAERDLG